MAQEIHIQVKPYQIENKPVAIVRKVAVDGQWITAKFGLNHSGEWTEIAEGARYPDECIFPLNGFQIDLRELLETGFVLEKNGHHLSYNHDTWFYEVYVPDLGGYFPEHPVKTGTLEECLEYVKMARMPKD